MAQIPIENIYFLLCYAWNHLDEKDIVSINTTDCTHLLDLFSRVLASGTAHLLKRGLDRGYIPVEEDTQTVRGRIDFTGSVKRNLLTQRRVRCCFDEFEHDVVHNRILKTTIGALLRHPQLAAENLESLANVYRRLHQISDIHLDRHAFASVRLHRNNAFYGFLVNICHMVYENVLSKEGDGDYLFRDFLRNERQMARLFEAFVRNFLKIELEPLSPACEVIGAEEITWNVSYADDASIALLPKMKTDISIAWPDRYLIIDTKFYSQTLQTYYDKESIHSGHLYQLFAYLKQIEGKGARYHECDGMLIYPTVTDEVDLSFTTMGHDVRVKTIDLLRPWDMIAKRLLSSCLETEAGSGRH